MLTYAGYRLEPSIPCQVGSPGLSPPLASNTLLVPSRLAFLQRSASGTDCLRLRYCIRSSTRCCLSMFRDTSDGNELAMPATNACQKEHSVVCWILYMLSLRPVGILHTVACCMMP